MWSQRAEKEENSCWVAVSVEEAKVREEGAQFEAGALEDDGEVRPGREGEGKPLAGVRTSDLQSFPPGYPPIRQNQPVGRSSMM